MMSPQVLTSAMPPKKMVIPVKMLTFPGNFSGENISLRRNLERVDSLGS